MDILMARRPVFVPDPEGEAPVRTVSVEFSWHPGLAASQKQKSIASLHASAQSSVGIDSVLEVSSKSVVPLGVALSAFNLPFPMPNRIGTVCVECVFQGSKVFELGGPYRDIFGKTGRDGKRDPRLQNSGRLTGFSFMGSDWGLEPQTAFYDWLYMNALMSRQELADHVKAYSAFTDIEFNPERSINCQAYSVALFVSLSKSGQLNNATRSKQAFLNILQTRKISNTRQNDTVQGRLF
jgi:hypothetical protein